ncbi:MAG: electron transport complex protein RnfA [Candidatus Izemoplasmataceae bacterium]|jgi:Na+-translocating ferredoxin:NAD+ oxidoreductase subunit A|uniref:electron transport complex protein RnfA n=1 Tax=Liberiplasma polymorphum TaxID=3374570 RepID=UPI003774C600
MSWTVFFVAIFSSMLINNVILLRFLGVCPFLGVSKKSSSALGMSMAVMFVMVVASAVTYLLYYLVLVPLNIEYVQTIAFILIIASLVQLVEMFIKKTSKALYKSLGIYLPLITTNCAILGVAVSNISDDFAGQYSVFPGFAVAIVTAFGTALGFGLIMFAFSSIRERLDSANTPDSWKGVPVALVTAGIMAIAFLGLAGIV